MLDRLRWRPAVRAQGDDGAVLAETALVMPVLVLFLLGTIEFGSVYSQQLNLRHGAREGARMVAVNYNPAGQTGSNQADTIGAAICQKMDLAKGATITLSVDTSFADPTSPGRYATVKVSAPVTQITGFFGPVLSSKKISSTVSSRIEQTQTWTDVGSGFASRSYTCS